MKFIRSLRQPKRPGFLIAPIVKRKKRGFVAGILLLCAVLLYWLLRQRSPRFVHYDAFGIDIPTRYEVHGIDVSKYQGRIDWEAVKQMEVQGTRIGFAFIKATEGITQQDASFRRNWQEARKAGLLCGAYHYFYSTRDPVLQARNFIRQVSIQTGDLPPVLDMEISNGQPDSVIRRTAKLWLDTIERAYGVKPIIYTNLHFYERYLGKAFDDYPLWISHYYQRNEPRIQREWLFWQHNDSGRVDGIETYVDFDVFSGDSSDLQELCVP